MHITTVRTCCMALLLGLRLRWRWWRQPPRHRHPTTPTTPTIPMCRMATSPPPRCAQPPGWTTHCACTRHRLCANPGTRYPVIYGWTATSVWPDGTTLDELGVQAILVGGRSDLRDLATRPWAAPLLRFVTDAGALLWTPSPHAKAKPHAGGAFILAAALWRWHCSWTNWATKYFITTFAGRRLGREQPPTEAGRQEPLLFAAATAD